MSLCVPVMERVSLFFYGAFNLMSQHEKIKSKKQQEKIQKFHGRYEKICYRLKRANKRSSLIFAAHRKVERGIMKFLDDACGTSSNQKVNWLVSRKNQTGTSLLFHSSLDMRHNSNISRTS